MTIPYFGEIDIDSLKDHYESTLEINALTATVDLNFDTDRMEADAIEKLNDCLKNIDTIVSNSWQWIVEDYKNGEDVKEYISFHLDDFFEDNPEEILKGTNPALNNDDRFLQKLRVHRIGIYPSSASHYLVIDWMTDPELSNYILVVNVNDKLKLEYITVES